MLNFICGFLWGILCSILLMDLFISSFNIAWWIYLIVFVIMFIGSIVLKMYLLFSDYKALATTGMSLASKIDKYILKNRNSKITKN